MASPFVKEVVRSIGRSKGRFIAIAVIAALGVGFFAGLQMAAPDMRLAADEYYDGTGLIDIRVASTLGVDDQMIDELAQIEGVEQVVPEREVDVSGTISGTEYSIRLHSLNAESAQASYMTDDNTVVTDDPTYLNRPVLVEGSWPTHSGECVLGVDTVFENPVEIGTQISINSVSGDYEVSDMLTTDTLTVVGFVRSSYYICSSNLGSTQFGDGNLDDYAYIADTDFNQDNPYTGAFIVVEGAKQFISGTSEYKNVVNAVEDRIAEQKSQIAAGRLARIKADAQKQIDDAQAEYDDAKLEVQQELNDAKQQLDSALSTLNASQITIDSTQAQLEQAEQQYSNGVEILEQQTQQIQDTFAEKEAEIDQKETELNEAAAHLSEYEQQLQWVEYGLKQAQQYRAECQQKLDDLIATDPDNPRIKILQYAIWLFDEAIPELQDIQTSLAAAIAAIEQGPQQIADARAQLAAARESAQQQLDAAAAELANSREQLDAGWKQLRQGQQQYAEGYAEYSSGLAEYNSAAVDAQQQLDDAQAKIDDAREDLNSIDSPELYVLDRTKMVGAESFSSDAGRIQNIAQVFPLIFFLVAALVALTTMTRMVDEERALIGTYKALGYSGVKVASKYLVYAFLASGVGSIVGIAVLTQFLPSFIMNAYGIIYKPPTTPTPIDINIALFAAGLGIGIILLATLWAAYSTMRETPALLMLPKAPKVGKRILLEHIKPLWSHMSFSWKVTARNIFRYKKRFIMAIAGVAGCTALLLTGFGLSDSINDILNKQFDSENSIFNYNMSITLDSDATAEQLQNVQQVLENDPSVSGFVFARSENTIAQTDAYGNQSVTLVIPQNAEELQQFINMKTRKTQQPIILDDGQAVITEKLATRAGIDVGDSITLYTQDAVGNATGEGTTFTVGAVMENYVSNYVYVTSSDYQDATGTRPQSNVVYFNNAGGKEAQDAISERLLATDGVLIVGFTDEAVSYYRQALKSVDSVVYILIASAAVLAFVVLYNLTNINISERQREIATLKVLGFNSREVSAYIFREMILLSLIGAILGLFLGIALENFVVLTAEVDQVMFGRDIHALSFLFAFVLTMVFSILVSLVMRGKLLKIDMVESLKSVE